MHDFCVALSTAGLVQVKRPLPNFEIAKWSRTIYMSVIVLENEHYARHKGGHVLKKLGLCFLI